MDCTMKQQTTRLERIVISCWNMTHTNDFACPSTVSRDPVEFPRRLRVRMGFLAPDGETLCVASSNIAPNVPQVCDVVPDLPAQFGIELYAPQLITRELLLWLGSVGRSGRAWGSGNGFRQSRWDIV